jgi:hypothetical protein
MKHRSIFWPLVLIAAGVIWLLVSTGKIPQENIWALTHIFPFILIALGLGLILRAYWDLTGIFISLMVVAGAVVAVLYAPQFGWDKSPNWIVWSSNSDFTGAIKGSGIVKSETREISDFNAISIDYPANVILKQGQQHAVKVEADDNLLPQLDISVQGDTLHLRNNERNWSQRVYTTEPVILTITVVDLRALNFPTAGSIEMDGLETDSLDVSVSGAGEVNLSNVKADAIEFAISGAGKIFVEGETNNLGLRISGVGEFNGANLQSQHANVRISGAGNATVWVERNLEARISGTGSIRYYGDPVSVDKNISGLGNVRSLGDK